jgi:diguanylate cyclase (GGDEF)-like protein
MYSRHFPTIKGIQCVGCAFLVSSSAFLLIGLRNYIPDLFSIIIPNVLLVLSMAMIHLGLASFYEFDRYSIKITHGFMLLLMLISAVIFTYIDYNTNARIVAVSFIVSFQCVFIMRSLLAAHQVNEHYASFSIAMSFLLFATFFAFRGLFTLSEEPLQDFMSAGLMHSLSIIVYQFVVILTSFGLVWIVSHKIQKVLTEQATHDPLTKVFNRRALEEIINTEHSRSLRNRAPLSVVMLDIDHFKKLNDRYGHNIGDQVLISVADILIQNTRAYDSIARFGGEEFILLLPDTAVDKAKLIAEKLRLKIASYQYGHDYADSIEITASFGATECDLAKENWLQVLERADSALYLAKESGRNRVIVFNSDNQDAENISTG